MPYGLDNQGRPTFLISAMAMHTRNLLCDPRASLFITQAETQHNLLGMGRITLLGTVERVPEADLMQVRKDYLERHTEASAWVDFGDFAFFRMQVMDSYFVGGFGVMGWIAADEYVQAQVDPLADMAASILDHMNDDHGDALVRIAQHFGQCTAEQVTMTAVDRLGFHVQVRHQGEMQSLRLPFPREARSAEAVRATLVEMVREARAARA
jgi:hypothetical protein